MAAETGAGLAQAADCICWLCSHCDLHRSLTTSSFPRLMSSLSSASHTSSLPPSHPQSSPPPNLLHHRPTPPPPPNSLFLFDLSSLQGWLLPKRGERSGTWLCLRHSHFQCHKFQFPILLRSPLSSILFFPLPSSTSHGAHPSSWEFVNSLCFSVSPRSHSFQLPLLQNTYWLLSRLVSSPRLLPHRMQFSPGRIPWWDPNERSLIFCWERNGVVSSYFKYCHSPPPATPPLYTRLPQRWSLSTCSTSGGWRWSLFFSLHVLWWMPGVHLLAARTNLTGARKDICSSEGL